MITCLHDFCDIHSVHSVPDFNIKQTLVKYKNLKGRIKLDAQYFRSFRL